MKETEEIISDAVIAELAEERGQELEPINTLFRTNDPVKVLEEAARIATALKDVLRSQDLTSNIQGKEHVKVEGWQTLGAMLGVTPICVWTKESPDGWEARVEARTLDERVVGAAEAMCSRKEKRWKTADEYAIRSMAQTRATSKALASVLRFVVTLAGYEGTPAEEMVGQALEGTARPSSRGAKVTGDKPQATVEVATAKQQRMIWARARAAGIDEEQMKKIFTKVAGVSHTDRIPADRVDEILIAINGA